MPGFHHFQGIPQRISYDNLKVAVQRILEGRNRQEQQAFIVFRSHYLFESHFCTPGQGNEKGGVEDGVGFGRRNFLVPLPQVASFAELNALLLAECLADDQRRVDRQPVTIGEAWELEKPLCCHCQPRDLPCCVTRPVHLTPYSQVEFETNRYSVPADKAYRNLVLKAYPFRVDILYLDEVIASHPRCYGREQDIFDPLHYLPLLEQRPGAFEHAKPIRRWRRPVATGLRALPGPAAGRGERRSRRAGVRAHPETAPRPPSRAGRSRPWSRPWSMAASMPMGSSSVCASCCIRTGAPPALTWPTIRNWRSWWQRRSRPT